MRFVLVLFASAASGWLFHELNSLGAPIPKSVFWYLGWLCGATLLAFFAVQHVPQTERGYAWFFGLTLGPAIFLAVGIMLAFARGLSLEGGVLLMTGAIFVSLAVLHELVTYVGWEALHTKIALLQGYFLTFCGIVTLASLIPPRPLLGMALRLGFGLFWLGVGLFAFALSVGITRNARVWAEMNSWFPSTCAIVLFGGLAFFVHRSHSELSHQENLDAALVANRAVQQIYAEEM